MSKLVESAFNGGVEVYNIKPTMEIDLLTYLNSVNAEIDEIVQNKTNHGAHKVQLTAELKFLNRRVDKEDEHTTIFAKTDMKTVYYDGLSEDEFFTMVQQMICVLNCFLSNGSGWVLGKISNLELKIVKFNPTRGSSYLALPSELVNNRHLLNINNSNCFLYCYTAAYHMK